MSDAVDLGLVPPGLRDADLVALADSYGTPLFLYDEDEIRRRCRWYRSAFGDGNVIYASKAFLCLAMARLVEEEQLLLDVASAGELHVAAVAGTLPEHLVLHGNNKSAAELRRGLELGAGRIVADSPDELDRLERLTAETGVRPRVLVRVTPGVEAHTHELIETGTDRSKFGFSARSGAAAAAAARVVASGTLELAGLHAHIGSQVFALESYERAARVVVRLAREIEHDTGAAIAELDLGGGLGIRYGALDRAPSIDEYAHRLRDAVDAAVRDEGLASVPRLMVEPGRSIVGPAAVTLYRVGTVKESFGGETFVAVDGGMSDNLRPALYGARYEAYLPARAGAARDRRVQLVGMHCEQGDVLVPDAALPEDVAVGDVVAVPGTGAYGHSMASNYNKVPRPAVAFVTGGTAREVVARETLDDLVRLDRS